MKVSCSSPDLPSLTRGKEGGGKGSTVRSPHDFFVSFARRHRGRGARRRRRHCDAPRSPRPADAAARIAASSPRIRCPPTALLRGGVLQLSRWGLLDQVIAAGTPPVRRSTFRYGDETAVITHRPSPGVDALYVPRRTILDDLLVRAGRRCRRGHPLRGARDRCDRAQRRSRRWERRSRRRARHRGRRADPRAARA